MKEKESGTLKATDWLTGLQQGLQSAESGVESIMSRKPQERHGGRKKPSGGEDRPLTHPADSAPPRPPPQTRFSRRNLENRTGHDSEEYSSFHRMSQPFDQQDGIGFPK